jgi:hypothetical protein
LSAGFGVPPKRTLTQVPFAHREKYENVEAMAAEQG